MEGRAQHPTCTEEQGRGETANEPRDLEIIWPEQMEPPAERVMCA